MTQSEKKEIRFQGAPVSEGIAFGSPHFLKTLEEDLPDFEISLGEVDSEIARYRQAIFSSKEDLNQLRADLAMEGSDEAARFIETHIQMLDDPMITTHMEEKIRQTLRNPESVVHSEINEYENRFAKRTDSYFQERLIDVMDVSKRVLGHLRERRDDQMMEIPSKSVVISAEIDPSFTAAVHAMQVGAFVTQSGGGNSHAALIARSKGIPYVSNIEVNLLESLEMDQLIIDGFEGLVIVNPSEETVAAYLKQQEALATRYQLFLKENHLKAETIDGLEVQLFVNVGNPQDLEAFPYNHDGVGLFRTEYLFFQTDEFYPSESYQEEMYTNLVKEMGDRPVVIRVFDLGGDKHPSLFLDRRKEPNPVLGLRGIRFLLRNPKLFKMQLRAIFKASLHGNVQLLLPLISDISELHQSLALIQEVRQELQVHHLDAFEIPVGCMVEVPSAVMICDALAKHCDFLSIGTNDLVQYTLGVDRGNPSMRELYYPAHPSVLRMIKMISTEAKRRSRPLTICGEIASSTLFTPLLLGLGLNQLSIAPRYVPLVKQTIRRWRVTEAFDLAQKALRLTDPKEISDLLHAAQKKT